MKHTKSLILSLSVSSVCSSTAAVVVTDGQVSANNFTFNIPHSSTVPGSPEANAADLTNVAVAADTSRFFAALAPAASILYDFDFTGSTYRPTSVSVRDRIAIFTQPSTIAMTEWSPDLVTWNPIRSVAGSAGVVDSLSTDVVSITGSPDHFYYRVTFENDPGFDGISFPVQWNRLDSSADDLTASFLTSFTVAAVPEPSSSLLMGLATLGLISRRKR